MWTFKKHKSNWLEHKIPEAVKAVGLDAEYYVAKLLFKAI